MGDRGQQTEGRSPDQGMEAEFGVVAAWTADAVRQLGPHHAMPAACRGSASPTGLAWLGEACEVRRGSIMVDVGGGMGGAAAYAVERFGVRALVAEPMVAACRAATELFGLPAPAADGAHLPLADASADVVWCLGVLSTTPDKAGLLAEIARVLKPGGPLGLLVYTADDPHPSGAPDGNDFPSSDSLPGLLREHGLEVVEQRALAEAGDFSVAPLSWTGRADAVTALVDRSHEGDPRLVAAHEQEQQIGKLLQDGVVTATLMHAVRSGG